jgi:hypothetical protein
MFETFKAAFQPDSGMCSTNLAACSEVPIDDAGLTALFSQYGGTSFNQGIYRIFSVNDVAYWNEMVSSAFPDFLGRVVCFSVDWLGRVFSTDTARLEDKLPGVVMFEPGTGEVLEIPCNIESFHENELVQYSEELLASSFYRRWCDKGGRTPSINECIGYKKPLFLGGKDTIENLEVSDLDVYWTISSQLIQKTKGLPAGSVISRIKIKE